MPTQLPKGKANTDSWDDAFGLYTVNDEDCPLLQTTDGNCRHDWAMYRGFNFDYEYCTKCNKTKESK